MTSELTHETRKASFWRSLVGTDPRSKNFCYRLSRRYESVIRYVSTPHATKETKTMAFLTPVPFCVLQAQALNQQSNLNEYFGVNSAGGVIAPRNRKAYASKRLQQVVNDFREQRRRATETSNKDKNKNDDADADSEQSSSSSEGDIEAPPKPTAKRGKARGGSSVGDAGKRRGRGGRGRGSVRGARAGPSRKRKRSVTSTCSGGSDGADSDGQDLRSQGKTPPPPPSGTASRPRARPAFRGRGSQR